jgi:O-antigen biosynthesis protein
MKYIVWSYDYSHASAGPKVLHRLCHELNLAGQEAYIGAEWTTNPEWNTPTHAAPLDGDWCAIYPEVVSGNPWNAPRVARWVLNVPGKLGGDRTYQSSEYVFAWDRLFLDGVPLLNLPAIEADIYYDRRLPRHGELVYFGKGPRDYTKVHGAYEIHAEMRASRHLLADALNRATLMYCLDDVTGMTEIARLCGCPVLMVSTGERMEPDGFRERYLARWPVFRKQLATFIEITQAVPT